MVVNLTATLLSSADPRPVQIALAGTTAGQRFTIVGTSGDGSTWGVPGGAGVSTGSQVVRIDTRSALNTPIVYSAVVDGVTVAAAPVEVKHDGVAVIQTIDGLTVVDVEIASVTEPRNSDTRSGIFDVAARSDPAVRLEVPSSPVYTWQLDTDGVQSATMRAILKSGMPIVRRTVPGLRDLDPVVLGVVTSWKDELITVGGDTWRRWSLSVREIADPQPETPLIAFTWDDFDAAMTSRTWADFDTLFDTWDDFDATDWSLL